MKVLVVEDERALKESILTYLRQEGYVCESADNFRDASLKTSDYSYVCVIVDLTLPGGNGLEIVRQLKENYPDTGIIIISAKNALDDKITGLEVGADDYLTKPFHLSELNARLKSVIRRRNFNGQKVVQAGAIKVFPDAAEASVEDSKLNLTKKEYDLLLYFIANRKRVLTKESIAEHLWGDHVDGLDSLDFVYTHIKNLRRKLQAAGGGDYIQSVYGLGYKFSC
ncbi:DNA-binding response OmpR family regulator [Pontibacter ummariensis]|uniref:DNA-binding response regulator, OmpR family, contains REC and winged-helix (WHTH) domain n=1 Tax=Pontibacter ummariensis TaxID=1610492 RepID=A0A239IY70_9BACT|nr:response regulator transcription factor [Pontibacter ummariensis]PRY09013.1 DNA-binding response OmpR family regulator [Pontibacter ummariensis]SNS98332.1 DNA-binding response regulator, OmpR family, contains REC and winged-helix (wHTH) domain [Pontibacter ummariensis]